ncbi:hypothetical protein [Ruminococcus sp.]|uniref:hypothetical protein n=1 Tax=Ruminococcus sp. TaxID=41978 RepID=UPI0025F67085|nr:hypothetical protein [Ruminococcus sp.]MBR1433089.1 hypothetical protein [Ruminococcus sp.]
MLLDEKDFTFTLVEQHRSDYSSTGLSGEILLADNGQEKYIVKYQEPFDAAIEFMAITLSEKLRLNCAPTAHLFIPSERFPHAVGIQFLPDVHKLTIKEGILKCVILNLLVQNGDKCEYAESGGKVYTFDFGESFCLDYHNKTEEFLSQCRLAHTDKKVRDRVIPILQIDNERYIHNLGYVNELNFLDTANFICKSIGLDEFTKAEVHSEWNHVWIRLRNLKPDAFVSMRDEISVVYGDFFANLCLSFIQGMESYFSS